MEKESLETLSMRISLKKKSSCVQHKMESIHKNLGEANMDVASIPGGLTSQLQALHVSLNKPFKQAVRILWTEWMAGDEDHEVTRAGGRLKRHSITLWCQWVHVDRMGEGGPSHRD